MLSRGMVVVKFALDIEKIHEMVEHACEDKTGVSNSEVEMNSGLQFHDGISTTKCNKF